MPDVARSAIVTRCAIYTRKSTECAKGQEINSLEGQREVCAAYVKCQAHKGWLELPERYDDEGFSGKNLDRPALHRLLTDVREGRVDVILFYKIDRLTRSLADFVRLMDALRHLKIAFVSVTQSFDTSDSMGRMVLNILLTFAQFEREMMGDRIRDKKATLKRNGYYVGRTPPIGYDLVHGRLVIEPREAQLVRRLFDRFGDYPSACSLLRAVDSEGGRKMLTAKRGKLRKRPLHQGTAYRMFSNPLYIGYQDLDGELVEGEHQPLVTKEQWLKVQDVIAGRPRRSHVADPTSHLLVNLIFDDFGRRLVPRMRGTARWPERYYESPPKSPGRPKYHDKIRIRALDTEDLIRATLVGLLLTPQDLRKALVRSHKFAEHIDRVAAKGEATALRLRTCSRAELRSIYEALLARVEVSRSELRIWIFVSDLAAYLDWSGLGLFQPLNGQGGVGSATYLITLDAWLYAPTGTSVCH